MFSIPYCHKLLPGYRHDLVKGFPLWPTESSRDLVKVHLFSDTAYPTLPWHKCLLTATGLIPLLLSHKECASKCLLVRLSSLQNKCERMWVTVCIFKSVNILLWFHVFSLKNISGYLAVACIPLTVDSMNLCPYEYIFFLNVVLLCRASRRTEIKAPSTKLKMYMFKIIIKKVSSWYYYYYQYDHDGDNYYCYYYCCCYYYDFLFWLQPLVTACLILFNFVSIVITVNNTFHDHETWFTYEHFLQ